MEIKKILWPNDFTESSHKMLPYVQSLAEQYDAKIYLQHTAEDLSNYGEFWGKPDERHVKGMHDFALRGARKKLEEFCSDELASCPAYDIQVTLGDPADEILKAIDEFDIDLVVISLRGTDGSKGRLGSVAQKILGESKVPVFAINPK